MSYKKGVVPESWKSSENFKTAMGEIGLLIKRMCTGFHIPNTHNFFITQVSSTSLIHLGNMLQGYPPGILVFVQCLKSLLLGSAADFTYTSSTQLISTNLISSISIFDNFLAYLGALNLISVMLFTGFTE